MGSFWVRAYWSRPTCVRDLFKSRTKIRSNKKLGLSMSTTSACRLPRHRQLSFHSSFKRCHGHANVVLRTQQPEDLRITSVIPAVLSPLLAGTTNWFPIDDWSRRHRLLRYDTRHRTARLVAQSPTSAHLHGRRPRKRCETVLSSYGFRI